MSLNLRRRVATFCTPFHPWYSPQLDTTRLGSGVAVDTQLNRYRINIDKPTVGDNPKLRHELCINPATDPGDHQSSTSVRVQRICQLHAQFNIPSSSAWIFAKTRAFFNGPPMNGLILRENMSTVRQHTISFTVNVVCETTLLSLLYQNRPRIYCPSCEPNN